jgi:threonine/homoserine/homoserine lactone efflux protein
MDDSSYWLVFITAAVVLNISPGPDLLYLISKTLSYGKRAGFATVLGLGSGALIHTLFVSLGISIIIAKSILVFNIMKYLGALYLLYLGIKAIFSGSMKFSDRNMSPKSESFFKSYIQAVLIDVTNPKVAVFFAAFLPQFYRNNGTSQLAQFMTLGFIIVAIGFIVESSIVMLSDRIQKEIKAKPIISRIIDTAFGGILIALGIRLIFDKK